MRARFLLVVLLALALAVLVSVVVRAYPYKLVYWNDKTYKEETGTIYWKYDLDVGRVPSSPGFSAGNPFYSEELWSGQGYWSSVNGWGWVLSGVVSKVYSDSNDYYFVMRGVSFSLDLVGTPLGSLKNYDPYTDSFAEKSGRAISYLVGGYGYGIDARSKPAGASGSFSVSSITLYVKGCQIYPTMKFELSRNLGVWIVVQGDGYVEFGSKTVEPNSEYRTTGFSPDDGVINLRAVNGGQYFQKWVVVFPDGSSYEVTENPVAITNVQFGKPFTDVKIIAVFGNTPPPPPPPPSPDTYLDVIAKGAFSGSDAIGYGTSCYRNVLGSWVCNSKFTTPTTYENTDKITKRLVAEMQGFAFDPQWSKSDPDMSLSCNGYWCTFYATPGYKMPSTVYYESVPVQESGEYIVFYKLLDGHHVRVRIFVGSQVVYDNSFETVPETDVLYVTGTANQGDTVKVEISAYGYWTGAIKMKIAVAEKGKFYRWRVIDKSSGYVIFTTSDPELVVTVPDKEYWVAELLLSEAGLRVSTQPMPDLPFYVNSSLVNAPYELYDTMPFTATLEPYEGVLSINVFEESLNIYAVTTAKQWSYGEFYGEYNLSLSGTLKPTAIGYRAKMEVYVGSQLVYSASTRTSKTISFTGEFTFNGEKVTIKLYPRTRFTGTLTLSKDVTLSFVKWVVDGKEVYDPVLNVSVSEMELVEAELWYYIPEAHVLKVATNIDSSGGYAVVDGEQYDTPRYFSDYGDRNYSVGFPDRVLVFSTPSIWFDKSETISGSVRYDFEIPSPGIYKITVNATRVNLNYGVDIKIYVDGRLAGRKDVAPGQEIFFSVIDYVHENFTVELRTSQILEISIRAYPLTGYYKFVEARIYRDGVLSETVVSNETVVEAVEGVNTTVYGVYRDTRTGFDLKSNIVPPASVGVDGVVDSYSLTINLDPGQPFYSYRGTSQVTASLSAPASVHYASSETVSGTVTDSSLETSKKFLGQANIGVEASSKTPFTLRIYAFGSPERLIAEIPAQLENGVHVVNTTLTEFLDNEGVRVYVEGSARVALDVSVDANFTFAGWRIDYGNGTVSDFNITSISFVVPDGNIYTVELLYDTGSSGGGSPPTQPPPSGNLSDAIYVVNVRTLDYCLEAGLPLSACTLDHFLPYDPLAVVINLSALNYTYPVNYSVDVPRYLEHATDERVTKWACNRAMDMLGSGGEKNGVVNGYTVVYFIVEARRLNYTAETIPVRVTISGGNWSVVYEVNATLARVKPVLAFRQPEPGWVEIRAVAVWSDTNTTVYGHWITWLLGNVNVGVGKEGYADILAGEFELPRSPGVYHVEPNAYPGFDAIEGATVEAVAVLVEGGIIPVGGGMARVWGRARMMLSDGRVVYARDGFVFMSGNGFSIEGRFYVEVVVNYPVHVVLRAYVPEWSDVLPVYCEDSVVSLSATG